jgi:NAD(P)-dependent dehydrogenase (short-subunit alcohol dehydrogenase family)
VSRNTCRSPGAGGLLATAIDVGLEATVVASFSRAGFVLRSRVEKWSAPPRLEGRVIAVTGASSGIGRAVALGLARLGAGLVLVGRDEERLADTMRSAIETPGAGAVATAPLDLVDPAAVGLFAEQLTSSEDRLDGLVHCAGALLRDYRTAPGGTELTLATHVVAPFRLSRLLFPLLRRAPSPVLVTVSSGGMYTQRFDLEHLELTRLDYRGATAYARAKRAQVVLAHEWARRWGPVGIASYAMHPGWVDTPGLAAGLPSFRHLGPLLRTPLEGADTAVWLAAGGPRRHTSSSERPGGIWLDRRRRPAFYLPNTYRSRDDRRRDGEALWEWCTRLLRNDACLRVP